MVELCIVVYVLAFLTIKPMLPTMDFRYQYDMNTPGTPTQLRMTSTRDLNLNVSVSNVNMIFQAYSSWYNLSRVEETYKQTVESQASFL